LVDAIGDHVLTGSNCDPKYIISPLLITLTFYSCFRHRPSASALAFSANFIILKFLTSTLFRSSSLTMEESCYPSTSSVVRWSSRSLMEI
jgi:hypothetical protein